MSEEPKGPSPTAVAVDGLVKFFTTILKEIGITSFLVVFVATFLIVYASKEQKQRFIDIWFLLESDRHIICIFIIVGVVALSIIGAVYYHAMLKISRNENTRLGTEKSLLQEMLLKQKLSSSEKHKE